MPPGGAGAKGGAWSCRERARRRERGWRDALDDPRVATFQLGPLEVDADALTAFCRRWAITELAAFGSVLRDDFRPDSDIDILVTFAPDEQWAFRDLMEMESELSRTLGRPVDLVERRAVEENPNWLTRQSILGSAKVLRVA
jgi:predicted nucleotidyltransferase